MSNKKRRRLQYELYITRDRHSRRMKTFCFFYFVFYLEVYPIEWAIDDHLKITFSVRYVVCSPIVHSYLHKFSLLVRNVFFPFFFILLLLLLTMYVISYEKKNEEKLISIRQFMRTKYMYIRVDAWLTRQKRLAVKNGGTRVGSEMRIVWVYARRDGVTLNGFRKWLDRFVHVRKKKPLTTCNGSYRRMNWNSL